MGRPKRPPDSVTTVETALAMLDGLQEPQGATISVLADHLGLAKSTVHRHLHTLYENEYVVCNNHECYVSLKLPSVGGTAKNRISLWERVSPVISPFAKHSGERALFKLEENGEGYFIHRHLGEHAVPTIRQSLRSYSLHTTAAGKAMLAHLPEARINEIMYTHCLPPATDGTITDPDGLFEEIELVQERGVASYHAESVIILRDGAVSTMVSKYVFHGAISQSGSDHRLRGTYYEAELPKLL